MWNAVKPAKSAFVFASTTPLPPVPGSGARPPTAPADLNVLRGRHQTPLEAEGTGQGWGLSSVTQVTQAGRELCGLHGILKFCIIL